MDAFGAEKPGGSEEEVDGAAGVKEDEPPGVKEPALALNTKALALALRPDMAEVSSKEQRGQWVHSALCDK